MNYDYLIVGAGFAGSVAAERLASRGNKVLIIERRNHIGGNAYDFYDDNGILIHKYGPHIFHTNSELVYNYLSRFTEWRKYEHKVLANLKNKLYQIPINRNTINSLYNKKFSSDEEVQLFYRSIREERYPIMTSEDIVVNKVGSDLYNKFFKFYSKKQWGIDPSELSPSVCGRIPIRASRDDRYFDDKYQVMPSLGYSEMFNKMLSHTNIKILLNTNYKDVINNIKYKKMIYTGPIDEFFNCKFGNLPYRSLNFDFEHIKKKFYQITGVVNYVDPEPKYTRIAEYKYLTGQQSDFTTISREYPKAKGEPFYPILTKKNVELYNLYKAEVLKQDNIVFIGRLAEYKYYNMDQIVADSLKAVEKENLK